MAKLVFGMNQSLDGYVDHMAFAPSPTLVQTVLQPDHVNQREAPARFELGDQTDIRTFGRLAAGHRPMKRQMHDSGR